MASYKEKFYAKYVSTHNAKLYGGIDMNRVRGNFPVWQKQYGRFLLSDRAAEVVDLGCGEGGLVAWLHSAGFKNAAGVDVSAEQITAGKAMGIEHLHEADLREFLRTHPNHFDLILVRDCLGHFAKDEVLEIVELMHGALRAGGRVIIKTPNAESPMTGRLRYGDFTHDTSFTGQSLRQLLSVYGFQNIQIHSMRPVAHGIVSSVRWLLWVVIEFKLRLYRLIEAGSWSGWYTQNVLAVGRKGI